MIGSLLQADFEEIIAAKDWDGLRDALSELDSSDIAELIIDLPPEHPIFHCFYEFSSFPQTPGLGSFLQGRTWEKGGYTAHLRAIEDDNGRAMVLINWNVDMGDGWEWSNAAEYPGYVKYTAMAYRMEINEIIYSLTH